MQNVITVELHLPMDIAQIIQLQEGVWQTSEQQWKVPLAIGLFVDRTISLAKAASLAEISRQEFALLLKQKNIPAYEYTVLEYQEDETFIHDMPR